VKGALGVSVELVRGSGGIFLVEVDGKVVARKTPERGFPDEQAVVTAVREALSGA
jgi:predicted Rdx family selenoprotein